MRGGRKREGKEGGGGGRERGRVCPWLALGKSLPSRYCFLVPVSVTTCMFSQMWVRGPHM